MAAVVMRVAVVGLGSVVCVGIAMLSTCLILYKVCDQIRRQCSLVSLCY